MYIYIQTKKTYLDGGQSTHNVISVDQQNTVNTQAVNKLYFLTQITLF